MLRQLAFAFGIVSVCLVIHTIGMVILADRLLRRRTTFEQKPRMAELAVILVVVFAIILTLHVAETAIWAAFYYWRELFPDYETSLYYSLKSFSTVGYGDVLLPEKWRLLGCVEGLTGALMCGLSTAFIFVIVNALIQIRGQQQQVRN